MTDLDRLIGNLRHAAVDPRLSAMDDNVLSGVALVRARSRARGQVVTMASLALFLGLGVSVFSPAGARAEPPFVLNQAPINAPSALLIGAR
jgi:hypothetical protein